MSDDRRSRTWRWAVPAVVATILVAGLATLGWRTRSALDRDGRAAFRDEVIGVIGTRFARGAVPVPGDPGTIEIGDARRDIARLYESARQLPEPERKRKIYVWFLGDPATASHVVVRDEPFPASTAQPQQTKPLLDDIAPKPVKTLSVRPDGSLAGPTRPR